MKVNYGTQYGIRVSHEDILTCLPQEVSSRTRTKCWHKAALCAAKGWTQWPLWEPPNSWYSMIPWVSAMRSVQDMCKKDRSEVEVSLCNFSCSCRLMKRYHNEQNKPPLSHFCPSPEQLGPMLSSLKELSSGSTVGLLFVIHTRSFNSVSIHSFNPSPPN